MTEKKRRTGLIFFLCLVFLFLSGPLYAVELYVNSSLFAVYPGTSETFSPYPIALPKGGETAFSFGHSLGELLPLFFSAYRMEIFSVDADGREIKTVIEREDLGDHLFESALVSGDQGGLDCIAEDRLYTEVERIHVFGDLLEDKSLHIWLSWEGVDELKEEIRRFAEAHGVRVKLVQVPSAETKLIATLRGGGTLPDLVMLQSASIADLVDARALQPLDYFSTNYVVKKGRDAFKLGGRLWAVPFYFDAQMLFYNPNLMTEDPDVEWSLEDFEKTAETVKNGHAELYPACWNAYSAYWLSPFIRAFGKKRLVERDGRIRIDDEATERAIEYLLSLSERGLLEVSERDAMTAYFSSGRAAMILTGSYSIPHFQRLGIPFRVLPLPVNQENGNPVAPFLDFKGFAITRRSRAPITARRFIQHLSGPGVQKRFSVRLNKLPARHDIWPVLQDEMVFFDEMRMSYEQGMPVPAERSYGIYKNTMWKLLRFVFGGKMTVPEVQKTGQRIIDTTLKN